MVELPLEGQGASGPAPQSMPRGTNTDRPKASSGLAQESQQDNRDLGRETTSRLNDPHHPSQSLQGSTIQETVVPEVESIHRHGAGLPVRAAEFP
eukprot:318858-Pyramimonas_sp.AAC.2